MRARTVGLLAAGLLFSSLTLIGQDTVQPTRPGASVPSAPAPPRPGAPTRDSPGQPAAAATGKIRGRVVSAESGAPLRRAQVRLLAGEARVALSANTDSDGRFEFANLPAARYALAVSRSGYVALQFGQQRPFEPGKPLDLADGQIIEKADFSLPRGGVIAGRVTDDIGEPVAGVSLEALRYQYMQNGERRLVPGGNVGSMGPSLTDDLGQFRVYGLMPGSYLLMATPSPADGFGRNMIGGPGIVVGTSTAPGAMSAPTANDSPIPSYFPGTSNAEEAQAIPVELGRESSAFFALSSGRLSRISGVVRNSQGRQVSGAIVLLRAQRGGIVSTGGMATSVDGTFTLANVAAGEYSIDVRPRPTGMPALTGGTQEAEQEFATVPVTVNGTDITGLTITTGPGAVIAGHLIFEGTNPRPAGGPLRVMASSPDLSVSTPLVAMQIENGIVDASGRFQIRGASGSVLFRPIIPSGWVLKSVTLDGVDITDVPYDVGGSRSVEVEVVLSDRVTNLSGTARSDRGEPLQDYVALFFPSNLRDGIVPARFIQVARPNQEGRYTLRSLPPGDYFAVAVESLEQGSQWDPSLRQRLKPRAKTFTLSEGQTLALDLQLAP